VKSRNVLAFALVIALTAHAKSQAVILDEQTTCSAAIDAFDSPDKDKMRAVGTYIEGVFAKLDQRYRESGEPGILVGLNDREAGMLMSVAVGLCRQRQNQTILDAASRAYRTMRGMHGLSSSPDH
jgi:hypothetical protein